MLSKYIKLSKNWKRRKTAKNVKDLYADVIILDSFKIHLLRSRVEGE